MTQMLSFQQDDTLAEVLHTIGNRTKLILLAVVTAVSICGVIVQWKVTECLAAWSLMDWVVITGQYCISAQGTTAHTTLQS